MGPIQKTHLKIMQADEHRESDRLRQYVVLCHLKKNIQTIFVIIDRVNIMNKKNS